MQQPIQLSDDGELTEEVDIPDSVSVEGGIEIHFTTGREVFYPTFGRLPVKEKHGKRQLAVGAAGFSSSPLPAYSEPSKLTKGLSSRLSKASAFLTQLNDDLNRDRLKLAFWLLIGACLWALAFDLVLFSIGY